MRGQSSVDWLRQAALPAKRVTRKSTHALALACLGLHVAPVSAETLQQALAGAYQSNPRLEAERARLRATDEDVPRALAGFRPQITGSADRGRSATEYKPASTLSGEKKTFPGLPYFSLR